MSFLVFGSPLVLFGLIALPLIWWLLRSVPPHPAIESFPPLRILLKLVQKEETPDKSPWWLLLLRLLIVALIIIALASPVWRPEAPAFDAKQPLALIIDNGFASAPIFKTQIETAERLITESEKQPIYLAVTAGANNQDFGPFTAHEAVQRLHALRAEPLAVERATIFERLSATLHGQQVDIAFLSDGLSERNDPAAFEMLSQLNHDEFHWYQGDISSLVGITKAENEANQLVVSLLRAKADKRQDVTLIAYDRAGLKLGESQTAFGEGNNKATAIFTLPLEVRNDITAIMVEPTRSAANTYLLGSDARRKKVGLLSVAINEMTQPLLAPLYYVAKALQDNSEVVSAGGGEFSDNIGQLINQRPSVIIIGDVASMAQNSEEALEDFIKKGGVLIRFAGAQLAASEHDDTLLPVKLRRGERNLGGVMSWAEPQKLGTFSQSSPFYGLSVPQDVIIHRQILAEPTPDLFEKSFITLTDGTPLVSAEKRGKGWLVFIHTAPDPSWSNLPLNGFFVTLLDRLIKLGNETETQKSDIGTITLSPWRVLDGMGRLSSPSSSVIAVNFDPQKPFQPSIANPPGLYGPKNHLVAFNLLSGRSNFDVLQNVPQAQKRFYLDATIMPLKGLLLGLAALLFALDCLIALWLGGLMTTFSSWLRKNHIALLLALPFALLWLNIPTPLWAQSSENAPSHPTSHDTKMVEAAASTHLAYIITGNDEIDSTSRAGLETLGLFIKQRTTIEPGNVAALDIEKNELAFYPLIYWPIDEKAERPSEKAIEKLNAYMSHGGTVLFDTRDQLTSGLDGDHPSPATLWLRDLLKNLNIPPLEAAADDHVVARSFFIMPEFAGRYHGSALWVEASHRQHQNNRPVQAGDGVSSILITANDFAGAWAHDGKGGWKYPIIPDDRMQRIWSLRGGLNIVMYVLTGNYKSDQVHAPELLKRLGREDDGL